MLAGLSSSEAGLMVDELEVWLSADHVGTLSWIHGRLSFRYTPLERGGLYS